MVKRNEITDTILAACKAVAPKVRWGFTLTGARKSNFIEGTVTCDEITFEKLSKGKTNGKAQYSLIIIMLDGTADIDAMADDLFDTFNDSNMGGLCYSVEVKRIAYGAIPTVTTSKAVKIELDVTYPIN